MTHTKINAPRAPVNKTLGRVAIVALCFALQACIGGSDPVPPVVVNPPPPVVNPPPPVVNPDPVVCPFLPVAATSFKGGDTWGEELTVSLDPDTMAYTIRIDASLQRTVGTEFTGTLVALEEACTYESTEAGAVFTLTAGGVVQGGVTAPDQQGFSPLLAFSETFNNADTPTVFNPVTVIANLIGIHHDGAGALSYAGSGRIRNAGTFQLCRDPATVGFIVYAASCTETEKGYLVYNADRDAFDVFTTDPQGSAVTTGGELTGSLIMGLVNGDSIPLQLVRDSVAGYGLRLYTPQATITAGTADGLFSTLDSEGGSGTALIAGENFTRGEASATLSYDSPVAGVIEASGEIAGNLLFDGGIYGFIPANAGNPAFQLGLRPPVVDPAPIACSFLPGSATSFKGGDTWGEELTVSLDPATMAYSIRIDASLQRAGGTEFTGTLVARAEECTYASDEAGAVFTLGAGGVVQGGVTAPDQQGFAPLLAFRDTFNNADTPTVFNPVAVIANLIGIHHDGAGALSYAGAGRIRNAGTFQLCRDPATIGFIIYAPSCTETEKGYLVYNADRDAFDVFTTDPLGSAVTTGGELTGSLVMGLVNGDSIPLQLVRDSMAGYGLRLYTPQASITAGTADGLFSRLDSEGGSGTAMITGANFNRGQASATLSYDSPVAGVIEASGEIAGNLLFDIGIYGFIPADDGKPAFELGLQR
jgi:hypothetical protein